MVDVAEEPGSLRERGQGSSKNEIVIRIADDGVPHSLRRLYVIKYYPVKLYRESFLPSSIVPKNRTLSHSEQGYLIASRLSRRHRLPNTLHTQAQIGESRMLRLIALTQTQLLDRIAALARPLAMEEDCHSD